MGKRRVIATAKSPNVSHNYEKHNEMKVSNIVKKIGLIYLGSLIIILLTNCGSYKRQHDYMITNIALESYVIELNQDSSRVSNLRPGIVIDSNEVYGLNIIFTDSVTQIIDLEANIMGFTNKAFATPPSVDYYNLINEIDSITIKTLNKLDSIYYEGTDVSNLFYVYLRNDIGTPFRTYFDNPTLPSWHHMLSNIDLVLFKKPKAGSIMQFEISVYFNDSTVTVLKTEEIKTK